MSELKLRPPKNRQRISDLGALAFSAFEEFDLAEALLGFFQGFIWTSEISPRSFGYDLVASSDSLDHHGALLHEDARAIALRASVSPVTFRPQEYETTFICRAKAVLLGCSKK
jgi:hypothetical protein